VRISRIEKGFTLIELIVIVSIVGILVGVAISKYINLTRDIANGTARGILGGLRAQNGLMFSQRVIGRTTTAFTMRDIGNNMSGLKGVTWTAASTLFRVTIAGNIYTFTLTPTPRAPTTFGSITAGTGTFRTW
jgi:prepilin-type N-terminal cleavage/methylation domain-containing protein